jgi:hypothetical protein
VHLVCRFGLSKVSEVLSKLNSISALPKSVTEGKLAEVLRIGAEEVAKVLPLLEKLCKKKVEEEVRIILTSPTSQCPSCGQDLVKHHRPTAVRVYTLKGLVNGEKWSLRCNGCKTICSYSKYGGANESSRWNLYENERVFVEASDCCFLEREVFDWMTSLRYDTVLTVHF